MRSSLILRVGFLLVIVCMSVLGAQKEGCSCGYLGIGSNPCTCGETVVKASKPAKPMHYASPQAINEAAAVRAASLKAAAERAAMLRAGSGSSQMQGAHTSIMGSLGSSSSSSTSVTSSNSARNVHSVYGSFGRGGLGGLLNAGYRIPGVTVIPSSGSGCGCSEALKKKNGPLEAQDLLALNPGTKIAPSFQPIGDLCYPAEVHPQTGALIRTLTKVTPAVPAKVTCSTCELPEPYQNCEQIMNGANGLGNHATTNIGISGSSGAFSGSNVNIVSQVRDYVNRPTGVSGSSIVSGVGGIADSNNVNGLGQFSGSGVTGGIGGFAGGNVISRSQEIDTNVAGGEFDESPSSCFDDDVPTVRTIPQVPADAVSLTLAYKNLVPPVIVHKQGKKIVPEDRLSFGPRTVPVNAEATQRTADIPEEKLLAVDRPIFELKPVAAPSSITVGGYDSTDEEEDFAEIEAMESEKLSEEQEDTHGSFISYKDLGYAPVKPSNVAREIIRTVTSSSQGSTSSKSNRITQSSCSSSSGGPCGPLGPPLPDYVPGNVFIEQQTIEAEQPKEEEDSYGNYAEEESSDDDDDDIEESRGLMGRLRTSARLQGSCPY